MAPLHSREIYRVPEFLEVSGLDFDVEVVGEQRSDLQLSIYTEEPERMEILTNRTTLRIGVNARPGQLFSRKPRGRLVIAVPTSINAAVQTASGRIRITGLSESRSLEVGTASGGIDMSEVTGRVEVRTASGSVRVEGASGRMSVRTASGAVTVENASGELECRTGSGAQNFEEFTGDIEAGSASGRISLSDVEGAFRLQSSSGAIVADGLLLAGDSEFKSVSGRIRLDIDNPMNELRFDSRSVSGQVRIGSSTGKHVVFGEGPIEVISNTTSGSQVIE
jgi:DUF4097 and DUF4098 domain-containing protein YvlB